MKKLCSTIDAVLLRYNHLFLLITFLWHGLLLFLVLSIDLQYITTGEGSSSQTFLRIANQNSIYHVFFSLDYQFHNVDVKRYTIYFNRWVILVEVLSIGLLRFLSKPLEKDRSELYPSKEMTDPRSILPKVVQILELILLGLILFFHYQNLLSIWQSDPPITSAIFFTIALCIAILSNYIRYDLTLIVLLPLLYYFLKFKEMQI